jgi:CDGSH-type Zn-finger protein
MKRTDQIPQKSPFILKLDPGKYSWCQCGYSKNMPFCDNSHRSEGKHTELRSYKFEINESRTVKICGCCQTNTPPYCDNTHNKIQ